MPDEMVDRAVYVETTRTLVRIQQLNDREYRLTGTPGPAPDPGDKTVKVVANLTELYKIYGDLGLVEVGTLTFAVKLIAQPLWTLFERPATQGWTQIRTVNKWKSRK